MVKEQHARCRGQRPRRRHEQAAAAEPAPARPSGYGANNKLVSRERADELRKRLRVLLGRRGMTTAPTAGSAQQYLACR